MHVTTLDEPAFSLVISRGDDLGLWGLFRDPGSATVVALAGRIALDEAEWKAAEEVRGVGGLACKAIFARYQRGGIDELKSLNGNFLVVLHDAALGRVHLVTDRCGMVPAFHTMSAESSPIFSTHPDLLAQVTESAPDFDLTSLGEFLVAGKVSFPNSYYQGVSSLDTGSIYTIDVHGPRAVLAKPMRHFRMEYRPDDRSNEWDLAEKLGEAFKNSVRRRTLPRLGRTAFSLSGGLDSRMLLCACPEDVKPLTFSFFDEENLEFRTARAIAAAEGAPFLPIRRDPEHYGNAAELGVKIHGGMGSLANNHFLGFRNALAAEGIQNIVTGFYCDYFFKGLALDRRKVKWFQTAVPSGFSQEWYRPIIPVASESGRGALERLEQAFPASRRNFGSDADRLWMEGQRLFPLAYEPDSAESLVPQRTMPWALPIVDNDVLDVYVTLPVRGKLSVSTYSKMVEMVCGKTVSKIPDSNTMAPVNASSARLFFQVCTKALLNRFERNLRPRLATSGSWPNWEYYVHHSPVLARLWHRENKDTADLLRSLAGFDPFSRSIESYKGPDVEFFVRLLTLKIWLDLKRR